MDLILVLCALACIHAFPISMAIHMCNSHMEFQHKRGGRLESILYLFFKYDSVLYLFFKYFKDVLYTHRVAYLLQWALVLALVAWATRNTWYLPAMAYVQRNLFQPVKDVVSHWTYVIVYCATTAINKARAVWMSLVNTVRFIRAAVTNAARAIRISIVDKARAVLRSTQAVVTNVARAIWVGTIDKVRAVWAGLVNTLLIARAAATHAARATWVSAVDKARAAWAAGVHITGAAWASLTNNARAVWVLLTNNARAVRAGITNLARVARASFTNNARTAWASLHAMLTHSQARLIPCILSWIALLVIITYASPSSTCIAVCTVAVCVLNSILWARMPLATNGILAWNLQMGAEAQEE
jgi:hypothetical protein